MTRLNLEKAAKEGRELAQKNPRFTPRASHMKEIADKNENQLFGSVGDAFFLGVRQGYRIAQKERKRNDK